MSSVIDRIRTFGEPFKRELIDRLLPTASLLDAGGMWGVHGAYSLHAATHGAGKVVIVDTLKTPEFEQWSAEVPNVSLVQHDMNDPGLLASLPRVETAICFEVLMHQALPLWTLHMLTSVATRRILLSVSVLAESRFPCPNGAIFLPGTPEEHQGWLHPEPGNKVFKIFSKDPALARSHSEWHWGLTSSLVTSMMKYLGWAPREEWRRPFRGQWEWWQAIFEPDSGVRL